MAMDAVVERFIEQTPVTVMARKATLVGRRLSCSNFRLLSYFESIVDFNA